jgi:glyoxylase-like metal-dependent hydrolase (beta-lactamase superfamily II)
VLHTPGHRVDSIALLDADTKTFFAGDTLSLGLLYCYYAGASIGEYVSVARHIRDLAPRIDVIAASHVPHLVTDVSALDDFVAVLGLALSAQHKSMADVIGEQCLCADLGEYTIMLPDPSKGHEPRLTCPLCG